VNLLGVANSVAAVLPGMLQRRRGHLVAISSLASYRGLPLMAGYCASKAGVNALLDALRVELRPHGISVTTICPGWIRTPLTANVRVPMRGMMEVDAAARQIARAIRRRVPFFAFPRSGVWPVRLLRWLPSGVSDWLVTRLMRHAEQGS
jgi:short-subunit dehydrogenase